MRTLFHPALLHEATGDPGVFIDLPDEGKAVLLDLPALEHVPSRKLSRVSHAIVTHTHMDHFAGFDHLLRLALKREEPLTITGPPGFLAAVSGRIGAYAWNLIGRYPVNIVVQEASGPVLRRERYSGVSGMRPQALPDLPVSMIAEAERSFRVDVAILDHGIPVLGVAVKESVHLAVHRDRLDRLGLRAGPWLATLKSAIRRNDPGASIEAERCDGMAEEHPAHRLERELITRGPGQVLAYLTDLAPSKDNFEKASTLVAGADLLICEAAFLHADAVLAAERNHLTARQAGELARGAGVRRLAVHHLSPRYQGREHELVEEAGLAFGGEVLRLPAVSHAGR